MDDIIIVVESKEKAKEVKRLVAAFLKDKLNLDINKDKTKVFRLTRE